MIPSILLTNHIHINNPVAVIYAVDQDAVNPVPTIRQVVIIISLPLSPLHTGSLNEDFSKLTSHHGIGRRFGSWARRRSVPEGEVKCIPLLGLIRSKSFMSI